MFVLFLSSDLVFSSRLAAAGKRLGISVATVSSVDEAVTSLQGNRIALVILDLSAAQADPRDAVPRLRQAQPGLAIVAYAPHVHEARLRAAEEIGCDEVWTRGQFDRLMDDVLTRYTGK